jgi:hypothetical protein
LRLGDFLSYLLTIFYIQHTVNCQLNSSQGAYGMFSIWKFLMGPNQGAKSRVSQKDKDAVVNSFLGNKNNSRSRQQHKSVGVQHRATAQKKPVATTSRVGNQRAATAANNNRAKREKSTGLVTRILNQGHEQEPVSDTGLVWID